jgi:hypothetical protein
MTRGMPSLSPQAMSIRPLYARVGLGDSGLDRRHSAFSPVTIPSDTPTRAAL